MGLYLNDNHPGIYRHENMPKGKNQVISFHSHQTEKLKEQARFNHSMLQHLLDMRAMHNKQQSEKFKKWKEWDADYEKVLQRLESISQENEQLLKKVDDQLKTQEDLHANLKSLTENEEVITKRIDEHDALMNKVTHQLNYLRNSLFERTNFLAEKIEEASKSILQYVKRKEPLSEQRMLREKEKIGM